MDKERKQRLARNEAVFREVNERIEEITRESRWLELMCECGDPQCKEPLSLTIAEYEAVRQEPTHFLVARGHVIPEIETVVESSDRFDVVRKLAGEGVFARETDPRS